MQDNYQRYAVCWVPARGSVLSEFGCSWTGWCAERGQSTRRMKVFEKISPPGPVGKTGLHGTLSAPFRLGGGRSFWALERVVGDFAARESSVQLKPLDLTVLGDRVSLVTSADPSLAALMRELERTLEPLAGRGVAVPRFEVPLTGGMGAEGLARVVAGLSPLLAGVMRKSHTVSDLALMGDPGGDRPWRLIERYPLAEGGRAAAAPSALDCFGPHLIAPLARSEFA